MNLARFCHSTIGRCSSFQASILILLLVMLSYVLFQLCNQMYQNSEAGLALITEPQTTAILTKLSSTTQLLTTTAASTTLRNTVFATTTLASNDSEWENLNITTPDAPNVIHFVIGLDESGATKPLKFLYYQYLAIKSAKIYGKPDAVHLHYYHKPVGIWFERVMRYVDNMLKIKNLTREIYGRKLDHFAHRSDVFRLLTLREEGGIFVDLDMIVLRPLNDLLKHDLVLGKEGQGGNVLLMSFTAAKKSSFFLKKWIESYKTFDGNQWNYHCCQMPGILAGKYPKHITILDYRATAWPMWDHNGIMEAFFFRTYDYATNYVTHLWETTTSIYMKNLTAHKIWQLDTSLFCKLRNLTLDEEGAGKWTAETRDRCELVRMRDASKRKKGLIGEWTLRNLHDSVLPQIPDTSGNCMNGILSPLNAYDLVNPKIANADLKFFAFRGDHIFLPMLPESSIRRFSLSFWFRLRDMELSDDKPRTVLTIDFQNAEVVIHLEVFNNCSNIRILVENIAKQEVEGNATLPVEVKKNQWYSLAIIGHDGVYTLVLREDCQTKLTSIRLEDSLFKTYHQYAMRSIWLGRRLPVGPLHYYRALEHVTDTHFDAADVQLHDSALELYEVFKASCFE